MLYHSDSFKSVASQLAALLRDANSAVVHFGSGEERSQAHLARAEVLRLAGRYLTRVRQYDLAYTALAGAITDAPRGGGVTPATAVSGACGVAGRVVSLGASSSSRGRACTRRGP